GAADKPIAICAAPGAAVTISGADRIRDWTPENGFGDDKVFSTPWPHQFINWTKRQTQPDDDQHLLVGRCEQVFVQGYLLRQVLKKSALTRGTFFADTDVKRLYVCVEHNSDLRKADDIVVEASTRFQTFISKGRFVHVRGLRFRYAANMAQH